MMTKTEVTAASIALLTPAIEALIDACLVGAVAAGQSEVLVDVPDNLVGAVVLGYKATGWACEVYVSSGGYDAEYRSYVKFTDLL